MKDSHDLNERTCIVEITFQYSVHYHRLKGDSDPSIVCMWFSKLPNGQNITKDFHSLYKENRKRIQRHIIIIWLGCSTSIAHRSSPIGNVDRTLELTRPQNHIILNEQEYSE